MITEFLLHHHWRSGGVPGTYTCRPDDAPALKAELDQNNAIATVTLSNGFITISLTGEALAHIAVEVASAGQHCVTSNALRGQTVPEAPTATLVNAQDWEHAKAALAAELTTTLAATAGAAAVGPGQSNAAAVGPGQSNAAAVGPGQSNTALEPAEAQPPEATRNPEIADAIAFAGDDAIRFTLARLHPGTAHPPDPAVIARHVLTNPAYAVRYAHAAAVAVLRWAGIDPADPGPTRGLPGEFRPHQLAEPGELALLDALSWLPERVATAARRGRPDEFARYLETLASRTIDIMSTTDYKAGPATPAERLWLAAAARTGLAAGLGLLGITAPDRI